MTPRIDTLTARALVALLLVATPVAMAITMVGDLEYAAKGSAGLLVRPVAPSGQGLEVVEVIPETPAEALGFRRGDRIVGVEGRPAPRAGDVNFQPAGTRQRVTVERDGSVRAVRLPYRDIFPEISLGLGPWIVAQAAAIIFYFIGLVVAWKSRRRVALLLTLACCLLALAFNGSSVTRLPVLDDFPLIRSFLILGREASIFLALAVGLTVHVAAVFPRPHPIFRRRPGRLLVCYLPVPLMIGVDACLAGTWPVTTVVLARLAIVAGGVAAVLLLLHRTARQSREERERREARVLFWGTLLGLGPYLAGLAASRFVAVAAGWTLFINVAVLLFPLSFAYVVLKNRFLGVDLLLTGGAKLAMVSRVADLGFVLLAAGLAGRPLYLIGRDGPKTATLVFLVVGLGVTVALVSVRQWLGRVLEERFFPRVFDARRTLHELADVAVTVLELPELLELVVEKVRAAFRLDRAAVLVRRGDRFAVQTAVGYPFPLGKASSLPAGGAVARLLADHPHGIRLYLEDPGCKACARVAEAPGELAVLRRLGASLVTPLRSRRGLVGLLSLGPKPAREVFTGGEMGLLADAAVQIGVAIENAQLTREIAAREQQRREIEKARDLQVSLLPGGDRTLRGLELAGRCVPAAEVAGDYYDYLELEDGRVAVILGDVTGHGLEAGMMMAVAKAALRTQAAARPALPDMLSAIDRAMRLATGPTLFMTAALLVHDPAERRLAYGVAGHPPPLLLRSGGEIRPLEAGFYPLGIEMDRPYAPAFVDVAPGDSLLLYSDGILEARDAAGDAFGLERLTAAFAATREGSAAEARDHVLAALDAFAGGTAQVDDVTVVVAKVR